jgi:hypothetical protein
MENMKYYNFYRESNNFDDILNDTNLKKKIKFKIQYLQNLILGFGYSPDEKLMAYIVLKYGDDIKNLTDFDYTPIPYKDYTPIRKSRQQSDE